MGEIKMDVTLILVGFRYLASIIQNIPTKTNKWIVEE